LKKNIVAVVVKLKIYIQNTVVPMKRHF